MFTPSFIPNPWLDSIVGAVGGWSNLGETSPQYDAAADSVGNIGDSLGLVQDVLGQVAEDPSILWVDPSSPSVRSPSLSYTGSGPGSSTAKEFEYYYADLARRYGMSRETAYNEAMANTAYQRAVVDMQMAGLNPAVLFSASKASTAGSGYVSRSSGGGFSSGKGASEDDQLPGWLYYGASALAQVVGTVATKSFMGGLTAQNVVQNLMRAWNGR